MGPPGQTFSRLGMGPAGQTLVDWAWILQGKLLVNWEWDLQEKQLLLSKARTRAAGSGEVKTGEELLPMQEPR